MVESQKALIQACENLGLKYEIIHKDQISVKVKAGKYNLYYTHWHNPYNRTDTRRIAKDKDLSYTLLKDVVNIPKWKAFIDPDIEKSYPNYTDIGTIYSYDEIINIIEKNFKYPLIIKPNMKSMGINVAKVDDRDETKNALQAIFDLNNRYYDYIAIAQQKIDIAHEYRVTTFRSKVVLAYEKSIKEAKFIGNLSPLHWDGGKAIHIIDEDLIQKFEDFCKPIHSLIDLEYAGYDIAIDTNGKMWLIEVNGNPAVGHFIKDCGMDAIIRKDEIILRQLMQD